MSFGEFQMSQTPKSKPLTTDVKSSSERIELLKKTYRKRIYNDLLKLYDYDLIVRYKRNIGHHGFDYIRKSHQPYQYDINGVPFVRDTMGRPVHHIIDGPTHIHGPMGGQPIDGQIHTSMGCGGCPFPTFPTGRGFPMGRIHGQMGGQPVHRLDGPIHTSIGGGMSRGMGDCQFPMGIGMSRGMGGMHGGFNPSRQHGNPVVEFNPHQRECPSLVVIEQIIKRSPHVPLREHFEKIVVPTHNKIAKENDEMKRLDLFDEFKAYIDELYLLAQHACQFERNQILNLKQ
jgi:hypothetical protein